MPNLPNSDNTKQNHMENEMIILGLILLVLGFVIGFPALYYVGGILVVVGVALVVLGSTGRAIGGRKHYF